MDGQLYLFVSALTYAGGLNGQAGFDTIEGCGFDTSALDAVHTDGYRFGHFSFSNCVFRGTVAVVSSRGITGRTYSNEGEHSHHDPQQHRGFIVSAGEAVNEDSRSDASDSYARGGDADLKSSSQQRLPAHGCILSLQISIGPGTTTD